jgi:hypothetical protein
MLSQRPPPFGDRHTLPPPRGSLPSAKYTTLVAGLARLTGSGSTAIAAIGAAAQFLVRSRQVRVTPWSSVLTIVPKSVPA